MAATPASRPSFVASSAASMLAAWDVWDSAQGSSLGGKIIAQQSQASHAAKGSNLQARQITVQSRDGDITKNWDTAMIDDVKIEYDRARDLAIRQAKEAMRDFLPDESVPLLEEGHLENEDCWLFFRNRKISVPENSKSLTANWAFAVGKLGLGLTVHDYYGDPDKLAWQMTKLSDFFRCHDAKGFYLKPTQSGEGKDV